LIKETDVLVIGGGPAGLAAAIAARRKGFHVTVADCAMPSMDKACGEGLMPDGLMALARLGIRIPALDSHPFRGIRFLDSGVTVEASFPNGPGRGVRRTTLHSILREHAAAAGVSMLWRARVGELDSIRSRWIVGADGENSHVRHSAGLDARVSERRRFGFRRHYRIAPWTDCMELYWGDACQIYVTPVASDAVCVAAISNLSRFRLDDALPQFPGLMQRLKGREALTTERGAVSASRRLKAVIRGRVALIGDASGSVDAITGEGLCLAFQQAAALGDALECGDLARYELEHRRIAARTDWMTTLLLALADHKWFRRGVFRTLEWNPWIFAKMLARHVGEDHDIDHLEAPPLCGAAVRTGERT
jgi:flavin-dependent dehydrogenase